MTKFYKCLNDKIKKTNKNKELDFNKRVNSIPERKKFMNNTCRFRNKNKFC